MGGPSPRTGKAAPPVTPLHEIPEIAARLAQRAARTDQSERVPREHLDWLAGAGYFRLGLPADRKGVEAPAAARRECRELLAASCGVTTFVAAQHVSACGALAAVADAEEHLSGRRLSGICFAHLRRPGAPCVTATETGDGWTFDGVAPWFTGWGLFDETILGGTMPDGRYAFARVPLDAGGLTASEPMRLCAMQASATVALYLDRVHVPSESLLRIATDEDLAKETRQATVRNASPSLGVVRAAATLMGHDLFQEEADLLRAWMDHWDPDAATAEEVAAFRADATVLGIRAASALVVAAGGEANRLDHPAQRLAREATFYSLTQLTPELKRATVERLVAG